MAKKEKMPKFSGFRMTKDGLGPPVYEVTMTVAPDDYGVSHSATNREMVNGVLNHVNGEIDALRARAEAAEQRAEALAAELAQARADRALLAGLWLIVVHHDVLPALLPTNQGDRDRLAAALDAVDRQTGAEARIAAGRAVIARIVAETGGGAA